MSLSSLSSVSRFFPTCFQFKLSKSLVQHSHKRSTTVDLSKPWRQLLLTFLWVHSCSVASSRGILSWHPLGVQVQVSEPHPGRCNRSGLLIGDYYLTICQWPNWLLNAGSLCSGRKVSVLFDREWKTTKWTIVEPCEQKIGHSLRPHKRSHTTHLKSVFFSQRDNIRFIYNFYTGTYFHLNMGGKSWGHRFFCASCPSLWGVSSISDNFLPFVSFMFYEHWLIAMYIWQYSQQIHR